LLFKSKKEIKFNFVAQTLFLNRYGENEKEVNEVIYGPTEKKPYKIHSALLFCWLCRPNPTSAGFRAWTVMGQFFYA